MVARGCGPTRAGDAAPSAPTPGPLQRTDLFGQLPGNPAPGGPPLGSLWPGRSLRDQIFFFLLRTALKDRPKGPPTANRQPPPTAANRQRRPTANCQPLPTATNHQSPTTNRRQPPPTATNRQLPTANRQPPTATNRRQPPAATNRQLPTTANRHQPPITNHQPPPTTTNRHQPPVANRQPPTANCRQPPTANRHQPWLSTWSARGLFWENWFWNTFFFLLRTALPVAMSVWAGKGRNLQQSRGGKNQGQRRGHSAAQTTHATRGGAHATRGNHEGARKAHVHHAQRWSTWASRTWQRGKAGGGQPGQYARGGAIGPHAHGHLAKHVVDDLDAEGSGQQQL